MNMNALGNTWRSRTALGLLLGGLLLGSGGSGHTAIAQAGAPPFLPVTIADFGPVTTNQPQVGWLAVEGAWVAYGALQPGCGHCHGHIGAIILQNVQDNRRITIRSAAASQNLTSMSTIGATDLRFQDGNLLWHQPSGPVTPQETFAPGDYACTVCYYNVQNGAGGPVGDELPPVPPQWSATVENGPAPRYRPQTLVLTHHGDAPYRIVLAADESATMPATDGEKVVYVKLGFDGYTQTQAIRLAGLNTPPAAFAAVWAKSDAAVAAGSVPRTWLWGPTPRFIGRESYAEGTGQSRAVLYYDKSRMEVNDPTQPAGDPYYVSNGLLVAEMISGQIQIGSTATISASVACTLPVVGDPRKGNPYTPSYSDLAGVASLHGDHQATNRSGLPVDDALALHGVISTDPAHAGLAHYAAYVPQTGHNIPDRFWTTLQGMQNTYGFDWIYVTGYPITEAYWTQMRVKGQDLPVLIQAYQRRVLTYVPGFAAEWQVQQGNVGQHYLEWRYTLNGLVLGSSDGYVAP